MRAMNTVVSWIRRQDEILRIGIVAAIGTVASYLTYEAVFFVNRIEPRATTSWTLSFAIGVFRQHHLHRYLSFPKTTARYEVTLQREWLASLIVLIGSVGLNFYLTQTLSLQHRIAWVACVVSAAGLEYGLLKFFVFRRSKKRKSGK